MGGLAYEDETIHTGDLLREDGKSGRVEHTDLRQLGPMVLNDLFASAEVISWGF